MEESFCKHTAIQGQWLMESQVSIETKNPHGPRAASLPRPQKTIGDYRIDAPEPADELSLTRKAKKTRAALHSAALDLMVEKGFQGATIRDICDRAQVSPATFYTYFASKLDILDDFYRTSDVFFSEQVAPLLVGRHPFEQMRIFSAQYAQLNIDTGIDFVRILYNPEDAYLALQRPMQDVLRPAAEQAISEHFVRDDIDLEELLFSIFANLRGITYTWCFMTGSFDLVERTLLQIDLLIDGLAR